MTDEEWITRIAEMIDARLEAFERRIIAAIDRLAGEIRDVRAQVVPVGTTKPAINGGQA